MQYRHNYRHYNTLYHHCSIVSLCRVLIPHLTLISDRFAAYAADDLSLIAIDTVSETRKR